MLDRLPIYLNHFHLMEREGSRHHLRQRAFLIWCPRFQWIRRGLPPLPESDVYNLRPTALTSSNGTWSSRHGTKAADALNDTLLPIKEWSPVCISLLNISLSR